MSLGLVVNFGGVWMVGFTFVRQTSSVRYFSWGTRVTRLFGVVMGHVGCIFMFLGSLRTPCMENGMLLLAVLVYIVIV